MSETVTHTRTYRGYRIETVVQSSGRKTYDIRTLSGSPVEWAAERLDVARAVVDSIMEGAE